MSGALGQHFARPGNRFWKVLNAAGFTDRIVAPADQLQLLDRGLGITNLVEGASRAAGSLTPAQLRAGAERLEAKVAQLEPAFVGVLGMLAFRTAFRRPDATVGEQPGGLGPARLWLLPNPSGLQAAYSYDQMVTLFAELRRAAFQ